MKDCKLLTIQDISCVGQCSLTVALPIISACGVETCILPSSVLSNHTGGFKTWTFLDMTAEMPGILDAWNKENIKFDAFYTGYVSKAQIPHILDIMRQTANDGALRIVDPVLGDNGRLYPGFDDSFPAEMRRLVNVADVILPNLTEASLLLGTQFRQDYTKADVESILHELLGLGAKSVVLTGISFENGKQGVAVCDGGEVTYHFTPSIEGSINGTGDCYASALAGALMRGKSLVEAASIAADFVYEAIRLTQQYPDHWYGVKFELALPFLINKVVGLR